MSRDWRGTRRDGDAVAERREELRRRVDEGYYLTPRVAWEVAWRIVASGDL